MTSASKAIPLRGWGEIAEAVGKALMQSVCVRTVQRYARQGRENRLPVAKYPNGQVYLRQRALALWAKVWREGMPTGARPPGRAA